MTAPNTVTGHRDRARRPPTGLWRIPVSRVVRLAPGLVRVSAGGAELAGFVGSGTDQHVKLYFYPQGALLPEPLTMETARAAMHWVRPAMRSYTIRRHDPIANEIDIDFVLHAGSGPASDWARGARDGDELVVVGPSPCYLLAPSASEFLLVGDTSALPAIEAILRELPTGARARVFVALADDAERRELPSSATVQVQWVDAAAPGELRAALRAAEPPSDGSAAWLAGERSVVREIRSDMLGEWRMDRARVRATPYWHRSHIGAVELGVDQPR